MRLSLGHHYPLDRRTFLVASSLPMSIFVLNLATLLGSLYRENDPRRDGGFTIYYMGVNLGAFLSPLVAGTLGERIGWHYGFASAGVGMCIGIVTFQRLSVPNDGNPVSVP